MRFRVSPCIGLVTPDVGRAAQFYVEEMGMDIEDQGEGVELLAGPLHLFLDPGPMGQPVFELLVSDLDDASGRLKFYGFETIVWNGVGSANLVRDPFGLVFNVFEFGDDDEFESAIQQEGTFFPHIGAVTTDLKSISEFYCAILQQPANKLSDDSVLISGGDLCLRFVEGESNASVVWLGPGANLSRLVRSGCEAIEHGGRVIADPFGLYWAVERRPAATHAVVHPL